MEELFRPRFDVGRKMVGFLNAGKTWFCFVLLYSTLKKLEHVILQTRKSYLPKKRRDLFLSEDLTSKSSRDWATNMGEHTTIRMHNNRIQG